MSDEVTILYFAALRERIGRDRETVPLADALTVASLLNARKAQDTRIDAAFAGLGVVRVAVNRQLAAWDAPVRPGDEVAFFPPMTGG